MTHVGAAVVRINAILSWPADKVAMRKPEKQDGIRRATAKPRHGGALDSVTADERKQNRKIQRQLGDVQLPGQVSPPARVQQCERNLG
jgi:hypothetical protein